MIEKYSTFTYLILCLNRAIRKIKTEEMAEYKFKSSHISCLYYVYKMNGITSKELCDLCGEDKASVSRSLDFLQREGYILNGAVENKKYKNPILLTEKGIAVSQIMCDKIDSALVKAGEGVTDGDREIMYRSLKIINENLNKICEEYDK